MAAQTGRYEAAFMGMYPTFEEDIGPALLWASDRATEIGCRITVVAPNREHFEEGPLANLLPSIRTETPHTLDRPGRLTQVVVAFWPSPADLEALDQIAGLRALCVAPQTEAAIAEWKRARSASDILASEVEPPIRTISDPVVRAAMKDLTSRVNLATGITRPEDRRAAIHAFKILHSNHHTFTDGEIRSWALAHGWAVDNAAELARVALAVLAGRIDHPGPNPWSPPTIEDWRDSAATSG